MTGVRRSGGWFDGADETALLHRVAVAGSGHRQGAPTVGVALTASDLNPCHGDVPRLVEAATTAIRRAGGTPLVFPVLSLGEDLMKPSAMMYRNLLSIDLEEMVRSSPIDGLLVFAGCDKNVPAALMALASCDIPGLVASVGVRAPGSLAGRRLAAGTDVWRELDALRAGETDEQQWAEFECALAAAGPGTCNVMGTAVSMGLLSEMLGMSLPGTSTMSARSGELLDAATRAGSTVVELVRTGVRPSSRMTAAAFRNAARTLAAAGGSTNAVIHLCAVAGRRGIPFSLTDFEDAVRPVPLLVDVEPCGAGLAQDFHASGSTPALAAALGHFLDGDVVAADGRRWHDHARPPAPGGVVRTLDDPLAPAPAFAVVSGNLAPDGALIKVAAATAELLEHRGPALVFDDYHDMRSRLDDPYLDVDPDTVVVVRNCGPVGAPGMPEWGMAPIPKHLAQQGVRDMVRVTDGRMSGTSFGTVVLHVAPEAAAGGILGLLRDGDVVELSIEQRRLSVAIDDDELEQRRATAPARANPHRRGWPLLYQQHVLQAPQGCDLDFLRAATADDEFIEPVIGRS